MKRILFLALLAAFLAGPASAQWLPAERQAHERKLWESTGVEYPAGLRFYELPKVSQRLVGIVNYNPENRYGIFDDKFRGFDGRSDNVNAQEPWITPSGLNWSPKDQWRKVAAAYFPGKVHVYRETIQVQNGIRDPYRGGFFKQPQPHVAWRVPDGTIFAEMLVRTPKAGPEFAFEIRRYEVHGGKMLNGETYRPFAEPPAGAVKKTIQAPPGKLSDFGLDWSTVTTHVASVKAEPRKLFASRITVTADDDHSFVPRGFLGTQRTCTDCHDRAGQPTSYGATTIRGSAPVLSWHPFKLENVNTDAMPTLDRRWPLTE